MKRITETEDVIINDGFAAIRPRETQAPGTGLQPDAPVSLLAKRAVLIGVLIVTGFYVYKSITSNGIEVVHHGVVHTRTIFAWIDIALAIVAAYLIIRYSRSLIS